MRYAILGLIFIGWAGVSGEAAAKQLPPPPDFVAALKQSGTHEFILRGVVLGPASNSSESQPNRVDTRKTPVDCSNINQWVLKVADRAGWTHVLADENLPPAAGVSRLVITFQAKRLYGTYSINAFSGFGGDSHETGAEIDWELRWLLDGREWTAKGTGLDPVKGVVYGSGVAPPDGYWYVALGSSDLWPLLAETLIRVRGIDAAMHGLLLVAPAESYGLFTSSEFSEYFHPDLRSELLSKLWGQLSSRSQDLLVERLRHPRHADRVLAAWHLEHFNWQPIPGTPEEVCIKFARGGITAGQRGYYEELVRQFGIRAIEPLGVVLRTADESRNRTAAAEALIKINTSASWREVRTAAKSDNVDAQSVLNKHAFDWLMGPPFLITVGILFVLGLCAVVAREAGLFKRAVRTHCAKPPARGKPKRPS